jgi:TetR/AcrR family transcriptional regulator, cholesterol catabolism regulator
VANVRHERDRSKFVARRTEIIDIAATLFARQGYAATGIAELGAAVDLARGALYHYIGSKESLLIEIHDRVMDPLLEQTTVVAALDSPTMDRLQNASEILLREIIAHPDHVWVFLHEYRALVGEPRAEFRKKRQRYEQLILSLFEEGVERGELSVPSAINATLAFIGMHNYTYTWIRRFPGLDATELSKEFCGIFFHGAEASPGSSAE